MPGFPTNVSRFNQKPPMKGSIYLPISIYSPLLFGNILVDKEPVAEFAFHII